MPRKKKNAEGEAEQAAFARLKDYIKGKSEYADNDGAIMDIAVLVVNLCGQLGALSSMVIDGLDEIGEMADALDALAEHILGEETDDLDEPQSGEYTIACPACKTSMELSREALMMEETVTCPSCHAVIGISTGGGCGGCNCDGGCKH